MSFYSQGLLCIGILKLAWTVRHLHCGTLALWPAMGGASRAFAKHRPSQLHGVPWGPDEPQKGVYGSYT